MSDSYKDKKRGIVEQRSHFHKKKSEPKRFVIQSRLWWDKWRTYHNGSDNLTEAFIELRRLKRKLSFYEFRVYDTLIGEVIRTDNI